MLPVAVVAPIWIAKISKPTLLPNIVMITVSLKDMAMSSGWMAAIMTVWPAKVCRD
jgi:hypothetical protein